MGKAKGADPFVEPERRWNVRFYPQILARSLKKRLVNALRNGEKCGESSVFWLLDS